MMDLSLTLACWNYDRCLPVLNGTVQIPGVSITTTILPPGQSFPLAVSTAPYDITELSASSYLIQVATGESLYQAIPVFVSRAFRHGGIYVRSDAGIDHPSDLEGRRVGVPEYQMTMALWVRGILADEYGVDTDRIRYRTGGTNVAGRKERLPLALPCHMDVAPIDPQHTLNQLFLEGELDAIIAPEPPHAFQQKHPSIKRLIEQPVDAEKDYFRRTGLFPIMHMIGIRRSLVSAHPGLATAIHSAFVTARKITMDDLQTTARASANRLHLPWFSDEWETTVALMGPDFWPYGVERNYPELDSMCRYSHQQHLTPGRLHVEQLFADETINLSGI